MVIPAKAALYTAGEYKANKKKAGDFSAGLLKF